MGLLKKIFKPVSKVLDKIVPNEIKPFLPYAAAFAPMMLGPGSFMGSGIMQRALMSGGANIFGQLSQEGNEGDINLLSAGLGALSGAMTTPEFGTKIDSLRGLGGQAGEAPVGIFNNNKYIDKGLMYLDKGADFMQAPGLPKFGIPAAQATGDLMFAQAKRDQDEADRLADEAAESEYASDASRALAIRQSMESYGFTEEEILDAIAAAGYKAGGRVGFRFGGIDKAIEGVSEEIQKDGQEGIMTAAKEDPMLVEEYNKYVFDLMEQRPNAKPMSFQDFKRMTMSGMKDGGIMATEIPLKKAVKNINKKGQPDTTMIKMKEGGLMDLGGKEMDLRGGGFVPIGKKEKADDVPARLSKNEFVMTADAVRAAGGGSVNEGAKRMYETMNKLEARA